MKTIVIDDEPWMLQYFRNECVGLGDIELVGSYRDPLKALEYAQNNTVDLAFIDMEMPQLSGVETAKKLGETMSGIKIIIVSAYEESYIAKMNKGVAYGYLRKPYKREDLRNAIDKIGSMIE